MTLKYMQNQILHISKPKIGTFLTILTLLEMTFRIMESAALTVAHTRLILSGPG